MVVKRTTVLIVGSGGSALIVAARLVRAGITDFRLISKGPDFGGVWQVNRYPGARVDVPGPAYAPSIELWTKWTCAYPDQREMLQYLMEMAEKHGLREKTDFETELLGATWSEEKASWIVETDRGVYETQFLVPATGVLEQPFIPPLDGLEAFEGDYFHSSLWPEGYDVRGKRVAVVGGGASAIQIVPGIAGVAEHVIAMQSSPMWILPRKFPVFSRAHRLFFQLLPGGAKLLRKRWLARSRRERDISPEAKREIALAYLEEKIADPVMRRQLTPDYAMGCTRPLYTDSFYDALVSDDVTFVADRAAATDAHRLISRGGRSFEVDTIVFATGFVVGGDIMDLIRRRDGRSISEVQAGHPRAYKSVAVSECPNLFLVGGAGPNSGSGGGKGYSDSGLNSAEFSSLYLVAMIEYMRDNGIRALEVTEEAERAWKDAVDEKLKDHVSITGGCHSLAVDEDGHNKIAWPGLAADMEREMSTFDPEPYKIIARVGGGSAAAQKNHQTVN